MRIKYKLPIDICCNSCNGTGAFQGSAERRDEAVVCNTCNGSGKQDFVFLDVFDGKRSFPPDVTTIVKYGENGKQKFMSAEKFQKWKPE